MSWDYAPEKVEQWRSRSMLCGAITGSGATGTCTVAGGEVTAAAVVTGGTLYHQAPTVLLYGGGGRGAIIRASVVAGVVTGFTVESPGVGYVTAPTLWVVGAAAAFGQLHYPGADILNDTYPLLIACEGDPYEAERSAPGESIGRCSIEGLAYFDGTFPIGKGEAIMRDYVHQLCEHDVGLFIVKASSSRASKVKRRQRSGAAMSTGKSFYTCAWRAEWEG